MMSGTKESGRVMPALVLNAVNCYGRLKSEVLQ